MTQMYISILLHDKEISQNFLCGWSLVFISFFSFFFFFSLLFLSLVPELGLSAQEIEFLFRLRCLLTLIYVTVNATALLTNKLKMVK